MILSVLLTLFYVAVTTNAQSYDYSNLDLHSSFASDLRVNLGNGTHITVDGLEKHFNNHFQTWTTSSLRECTKNGTDGNVSIDRNCILKKCLSPEDVYKLSGLGLRSTDREVSLMSMILVHLMENKTCSAELQIKPTSHHVRPSSVEAWGYGVLCTTIISLCSLGGLIALPFVHGINYKKMLILMVGLAVGTLTGSSLFFLIPEALELTEQELNEHSYVWKCLVMISGIYIFFVIERILKIFTERREVTKQDKNLHHEIHPGRFASFHEAAPVSEYRDLDSLPHVSPCGDRDSGDSVSRDGDSQSNVNEATVSILKNDHAYSHVPNGHSHGHSHHQHRHVAPVAWMIIFGDGLHNFIDGVSIGAAFTESILSGVSVSVAILCEELPHELGDFAVLLNAGMKIKRAVLYNFLSACMCYLGLIVGVFLGENVSAHTWVFAFAGGMFLYIALVDMMPEMNTAGEQEENKTLIGDGMIFLLQNVGLSVGFAIMFVMAVYGGDLEATIKGGNV